MNGLQGFNEYFEHNDTTVLEAALRKPKPDGQNIRQQVKEILRKKKPKDKKGLLIVFEGIDGAGKSWAAGTPVLMYDGSIKNIEDVQSGDLVMGDDSTSRTVISTHSGSDWMYDVIPKKGMIQRVNSRHAIVFGFACNGFKNVVKKNHGYAEMTAPEFMEQSRCFTRYAQLVRKSVEFPSQPINIDPYILGVWLGDGNSANTGFTTCDPEIVKAITEESDSRNLRVTVHTILGKKASRYTIVGSKAGIRDNSLRNNLKQYGLLNNKHIPLCYKSNSCEVRLQLLAGLIDTDGHVGKRAGCVDFINKNKQLAEDVAYLARSLGLAAYIKPCKKKCQTGAIGNYFRVSLSGDCHLIPTRIQRKIIPRRTINKNPLRVGFRVEPAGIGKYYGFETDGNHLFLLGDFTVVHNSTQVETLSKWLKEEENYDVMKTKWNSSKIMKEAIKDAKDKRILSPMLYSLMHAADMVIRYENEIVPGLMENKIVVADRYIYTSMVRDKARGVDVQIMNEIYKDFREPDILFHCTLPIHLAFSRIIKEKGLSYYGTGMDLNLADNKEENYLKYEDILDKYYKQILPMVSSYHKLNMGRDITTIAEEIKDVVANQTGIGKYR